MTLRIKYIPRTLKFKFDAGTSRGVLKERQTWFVTMATTGKPNRIGIGEAAPLKGLSSDDRQDFEGILAAYCQEFQLDTLPSAPSEVLRSVAMQIPEELPSLRFAFETALLDLMHGGEKQVFPGAFFQGNLALPTNGLVWMGNPDFMHRQIEEKLAQGFSCIKMKIGALNFDEECRLIASIRDRYAADQITIRVDANGAFLPQEALSKLQRLAAFQIHSIEQPIAPGQIPEMTKLCQESPIPIALDEELIGVYDEAKKEQLLREIQPQFIILKPTLAGGISSTQHWIKLAERMDIGWWMTSALESNIGLNAISQLVSTYPITLPQGLGTGGLFHNNIDSPLTLEKELLRYDVKKSWGSIS